MAKHRHAKDGAESLVRENRRIVALPLLLLLVPAVIVGAASWALLGSKPGVVAGTGVFVVIAVAITVGVSIRVQRLANTRQRMLRLERAMATASAALLTRGVADPVGTALVALVDGVDASSVFLDSVGDKEIDHTGIITTVRDVLRTTPTGEPAGWDLMPWRVTPATRDALEAGQACEIRPEELDTRTATLYRAAQVGSEIVLPITVEGSWVGNVGFSATAPGRVWSEGERQLLKVGAEMIGVYWERRDAAGRLQELVAAKDEFIASVSHEVRTPLTAVLGFAHELHEKRNKFNEKEQDDLIALIAVQSQEVANIVDDLLVAARAETGSVVVAIESLCVRTVIGEVLSSHSGRVDFSMGSPDDLEVLADPVRIRQILRNLLTNADRYGGSAVAINVNHTPDYVAIEVRDDGDGIPEKLRDHVFEPYARAHDVRSQPASVGLGLSVARKLAQLMKGDIELTHDGGWTIFTLTLPIGNQPFAAVASVEAAAPDALPRAASAAAGS
ncbi:MAG: GAF domain-containing sensor histidine kinase [Acidimicrobiia bacterium]|nr:GAF domain-containing sensor histidine kinase [Acidimicrobiia bacterium]